MLLGIYFLCLGINYMPMLMWTIAIGSRENARREVAPERAGKSAAMAKYRRVSLALLVPLLPIGLMVAQRARKRGLPEEEAVEIAPKSKRRANRNREWKDSRNRPPAGP